MAVVSVPSESVLRLRFQVGVDGDGNPLYRNKNFYNIKPGALDSDLFEVAQALAGLVQDTLESVARINTAELVNQ